MMKQLKTLTLSAFVGVILLVSACSSTDEEVGAIQVATPAEELYNNAADYMDAGDYKKATAEFNEVERQHPYSQWATRAQLMSAFGYYKAREYDQAAITLERFIKLHPGHEDIDYAYYLKALTSYEQISDVGRDQAMTMAALEDLSVLISRFPNSKYTRDAMLKRDLTLDHLAGKEMEIGRYYQGQGQHNAAISRFRTVVRNFQTTRHVAEALHRMVESYLALGIRPEATRVAAVLGHNYPGSKWYEETYDIMDDRARARILDKNSWTSRTLDSLNPWSDDEE
jgi:outer membrane protein assembly factor BamD